MSEEPIMSLMTHKSTTAATGDALGRMADRAEGLADRAAPMLERWSARAQNSLHHGVGAMRDASTRVRDQAVHASDATAGYIRDEPFKSVLIAAAIGAAAIGLALLARPHRY
jgi:ElaB/YqjD/DUF883 family membrane-anchored ribosome-binding protein